MKNKRDPLEYILMFIKQLEIDNLPLPECAYDMQKECGNIIVLLEELKAYRSMWEELEKITGATEWEMVDLEEIKQQYFPKVVK